MPESAVKILEDVLSAARAEHGVSGQGFWAVQAQKDFGRLPWAGEVLYLSARD